MGTSQNERYPKPIVSNSQTGIVQFRMNWGIPRLGNTHTRWCPAPSYVCWFTYLIDCFDVSTKISAVIFIMHQLSYH